VTSIPRFWSARAAPSLDEFEQLARHSFYAMPEMFRALVGEVTFSVDEFPEDEVVEELGLESPFDLLGLFQGVGMAHAFAAPPTGALPNRIWIFRRPILDYWAEHDETLEAIVSHVLIHEIGHHFGMDEDDLEELGYQ
jgi:predicted Zn-dependent protease with MMP-like domain